MKLITANLLKFALFFAFGSILFRIGLSWAITHQGYAEIWIFAIIYFLYNAGIGWIFGKKDYERFPLHDIGFRFHFTTYLIFNSIWELWFLLGFQSVNETVAIAHHIALYWGIFLIIHFVLYLLNRKNTIKGMDKSEIFE
jgi:hypothetical protein